MDVMDGSMDGWIDGWMDAHMYECMYVYMCDKFSLVELLMICII